MNNTNNTFTTERLVSSDENSTHDINVVCLWSPDNTLIEIVGWYYGEPDEDMTRRIIDDRVKK